MNVKRLDEGVEFSEMVGMSCKQEDPSIDKGQLRRMKDMRLGAMSSSTRLLRLPREGTVMEPRVQPCRSRWEISFESKVKRFRGRLWEGREVGTATRS